MRNEGSRGIPARRAISQPARRNHRVPLEIWLRCRSSQRQDRVSSLVATCSRVHGTASASSVPAPEGAASSAATFYTPGAVRETHWFHHRREDKGPKAL